jgi:hypothetical protein
LFKLTKKKVAAAAVAAGLVAMTGVGYAYFTDNGAGDGTATVGTSTEIELAGTITGTLYPDGDAADVSVLVTNNGAGSQYVDTVTLDSIEADSGHSACDVSEGDVGDAFTMDDITVHETLAAGGSTTVSGSLQMNDTGVSQDDCQGATLTLHFTST